MSPYPRDFRIICFASRREAGMQRGDLIGMVQTGSFHSRKHASLGRGESIQHDLNTSISTEEVVHLPDRRAGFFDLNNGICD